MHRAAFFRAAGIEAVGKVYQCYLNAFRVDNQRVDGAVGYGFVGCAGKADALHSGIVVQGFVKARRAPVHDMVVGGKKDVEAHACYVICVVCRGRERRISGIWFAAQGKLHVCH